MTVKTVAKHDDIETLDSYQAARKVTEMYLSSREPTTECFVNYDGTKLNYEEITFVPALVGSQREIIDNAVDELIAMRGGDSLRVEFNPLTLEFSVQDNGRGIRQDKIEEVFSNLHSGRNFNVREDGQGGLNGVGGAVVNFTSEYFIVDSWRDGKHYHQEFHESKWNMLDIRKPVITACTRKHGTKICYKPSATVFPDLTLPESYVKGRLYEVAFQYPQLKVYYNGIRLDGKKLFDGLNPVVVQVNNPELKFSCDFYLIPDFTGENDDHVQPMVNSICTYRGGEFIKAFRSEFYGGIVAQLTSRKLTPNRADVAAGVLVMAFAKMPAAKFDSQAKNYVINKIEAKAVKDALNETLFKAVVKKNKPWIDAIIERALARTTVRDDDDAKKKSKAAKNKKVAKLNDANGSDRSKCILLVGEGDSALNLATNVRDTNLHAILPLMGKIMNVTKNKTSEVMGNKAIQDLMGAIGLQYGVKADRSKLRYGKIWIATDEDVDGAHITGLLVNLFFSYWPELFNDKPFLYKLETPFIILKKGTERKYFYGDNYDSYKPEKYKGWSVTRAKGLGSLEETEWIDVFKQPKIVPLVYDDDMAETLSMLFHPDRAEDRKVWLEKQQ